MALLHRLVGAVFSPISVLRARLLRGRGFVGTRLVVEKERRFSAPPGKVFPLLCPTREYDWIEGWSCDLIYAESGFAENNCIFIRPETGETWMITRYDPARFLFEVAIFVSNRVVVKADISLVEEDGATSSRWRYTCTALDRIGNWLLAGPATRRRLEGRLERLLAQLDHYLKTGTKLVAG